MSVARAAALPARSRFVKAAVAAVVVAALAGGGGVRFSAAGAAVAAPRPAQGGGQLAAWTLTAQIPATDSTVMAVNPSADTVYIGGGGDDLEVISGLTGKQEGDIPLPAMPASAAVDPATSTIYVAAGHAVYAVSEQAGKVTAAIAVASSPDLVAVDPGTDTIYLASFGGDTITVINGETKAVTATIAVGDPATGIAVDPLTGTVYVSDGPAASGADGTVTVIDGAANTVTATVSAGPNLDAITADPRTDIIYAAGPESVSVISGTTNTVTATVQAGAASIAADPQTDTIYLVDLDGGFSAMSGLTNEFVAGLGLGGQGGTPGRVLPVAVDPMAGTVYVSYSPSFDVYGLDVIATCASGVLISPGTGCAKIAAAFQPAAASFASPAQGVLAAAEPGSPTVLMQTSDGGRRWSFLPAAGLRVAPELDDPPDDPGVLFTSPDDGWLVGRWHTSDGGATWQWDAPGNRGAIAMAAAAATLYAVAPLPSGARGLWSRPASGTAWTRITEVTASILTGLAASGHAVWLTSRTRLWATADGTHWHRYPARCPGAGYHLAAVAAASPSHVAFLCTRPARTSQSARNEILTSSDGGRTVHLAGPAPDTGFLDGFASPPGNPAVITLAELGTGPGPAARIYRSANSGRTWTTLPVHGNDLGSLTYTSRTDGWILLQKGPPITLLHTTDSGRTWHKITL
jgi:YVTN family beta-propeller protein